MPPDPPEAPPDPFTPTLITLPSGDCGVAGCGAAHMRGQRGAMEDAVVGIAVPGTPLLFVCVFDGHGGRWTADFAAAHLLLCVLATPEFAAAASAGAADESYPVLLGCALRAGFSACDAAAYEAACSCGPTDAIRSGATALAALVSSTHVVVANLGDSRAMIVRRGGAEALSADHKVDAPIERARLVARSGAAVKGRGYFAGLAVARALGDFRVKLDHGAATAGARPPLLPVGAQTVTSEPEVRVYARRHGDDAFLVLACDGVWDVASCDEAAGVVRAAVAAGATPAAAAAALILDCLERGSNDNLSAVVLDLGE